MQRSARDLSIKEALPMLINKSNNWFTTKDLAASKSRGLAVENISDRCHPPLGRSTLEILSHDHTREALVSKV
jgi:hypothetical protein